MKRTSLALLVLILALAACSSGGAADTPADATGAGDLLISGGETDLNYTVDDLKELPATEATFNEVTYVGVALTDLLQDAGVTAADLKAVKAVASDGYSVNYDPPLFTRDDVILAYATADGALSEDDGTLRMVLPGEEGKLNVRSIIEIQIYP